MKSPPDVSLKEKLQMASLVMLLTGDAHFAQTLIEIANAVDRLGIKSGSGLIAAIEVGGLSSKLPAATTIGDLEKQVLSDRQQIN